jgi:hypothetical protein
MSMTESELRTLPRKLAERLMDYRLKRSYVEAVIREAIEQTLDAAILAVEGERVEQVGAGDDSYNLALEHSAAAIRSLKPAKPEDEKCGTGN